MGHLRKSGGWLLLLLGSYLPALAQRTPFRVQSGAGQQAPGTWEFDVASIRPDPNPERRSRVMRHPDDTEFVAQNVSLHTLLEQAFGVNGPRILGLPQRLELARFDIQAKGDADTDARFHKLNPDQQRDAKQKMLQSLLTDRFKLQFHRETRELPVYALVAPKGAAKLAITDEVNLQAWGGRTHIYVEGGDTLTRFAEELTRVSGRPVLNKTGLTGRYDIELDWSADDDDDTDTPTLFTALQEQLGLKLESQKAMIDVVVVDHMELPSAN